MHVCTYRRSVFLCCKVCRSWPLGQSTCPVGRAHRRRIPGCGWTSQAYMENTRMYMPHLKERNGIIYSFNEGKHFIFFEIKMEKHTRNTSWPSIRMFFRSTGLTALEPSVTLVVLQYRILVPEFRFTWYMKKTTCYNDFWRIMWHWRLEQWL